MRYFTPIGPIPENYPYIEDLKREAWIDSRIEYHTGQKILEKNAHPKEKQKLRDKPIFERWTTEDWFVVSDPQKVARTYKSTTGKSKKNEKFLSTSTNNHNRFCMLLDYITWVGMKSFMRLGEKIPPRSAVFDVALGKADGLKLPDGTKLVLKDQVKDLKGMSWKELNDLLAAEGVPGYSPIGSAVSTDAKVTAADLEGRKIRAPGYGQPELAADEDTPF